MGSGNGRQVHRRLGRYALFGPIASGGMATVHFGRLIGPVGFTRTLAIKRLHPHLAHNPDFVAMFIDEARLAARVQHPNVVATLDVVALGGEVFLVMDYVRGESLSVILRATQGENEAVPPAILGTILSGVLHGLHAAHGAKNDGGEPLFIVHRDVSPQNILVGQDGVARLADFGVAKAALRAQSTRGGEVKGKLSYMAPEQLQNGAVDHRADLYAAAVVLWEGLTSRRLFEGDSPATILTEVLARDVPPPSAYQPGIPIALDRFVQRGLSRDPARRFATALEMATELDRVLPLAPQGVVADWVTRTVAPQLKERAARLAVIESTPIDGPADHVESERHPREDAHASISSTSTEILALTSAVGSRREGHAPASRRSARSWFALGVLVLAGALIAQTTTRRARQVSDFPRPRGP